MDRLFKIDEICSYTFSSSYTNRPQLFEWHEGKGASEYIFLTDFSLEEVDKLQDKTVLAWLIESPVISNWAMEYVKDNVHKFAKVYTFDKTLLTLSDKFKLVPLGGCWIDSEDRIVHHKNKLVSIVASRKNLLYGHKLRHNVVHYFGHRLDVFGTGYSPIINKIDGLKDYMFSIAIENCRSDYYFTEKVIDCFITGTIPIYWGCPSMSNFFNPDGVLDFSDIKDLGNVLKSLTPELYDRKRLAISENYELAKRYLVADDILYDEFHREFLT
jgi:hypothetical protein